MASFRSSSWWLGTSYYIRGRNLLHQPQEQDHILAWPTTWPTLWWVCDRLSLALFLILSTNPCICYLLNEITTKIIPRDVKKAASAVKSFFPNIFVTAFFIFSSRKLWLSDKTCISNSGFISGWFIVRSPHDIVWEWLVIPLVVENRLLQTTTPPPQNLHLTFCQPF